VMGMQAVWYERMRPARGLTLGELAVPEPGHGQVLVEVKASGVKRSLRCCWHCELFLLDLKPRTTEAMSPICAGV
jgi:D-arabinose 1-dehydrogenase-like Zn-dependent alcohol dehydrogenase